MSIVKKEKEATSNWYLPAIISGPFFTFGKMIKNLFNQKKMQTLNYPEEHYKYGPRFKGNHIHGEERWFTSLYCLYALCDQLPSSMY